MGQILNISVKKLLPKVTLLSAGDTQQVVCTSTVYLTATIQGDLTRHTTEWEQISGTPLVTLINVDSLNAYYEVIGPAGTDKVFRFWIDKNRSYAQYADVTVRTTPSDEISLHPTFGTVYSDATIPDAFRVTDYLLMGSLPFDDTIPFNSLGDTFDSNFTISWGLPNLYKSALDNETTRYASGFISTTLQGFDGSGWTNVHSVLPNDLREYVLPAYDKFRLNANYSLNGQSVSIGGHWFTVDANNTLLITAKTVISDRKLGVIDNSTTVSKIVYTLDLQTYDTTIENLTPSTPLYNNVELNRIVYTLDLLMEDDVITDLFGQSDLNVTYSITRTTTGTIGG